MTENERLTHSRASGYKDGLLSPSTKAELVERLAAYEDTGLEPQEVQALADDSRRSDEAAAGWISVGGQAAASGADGHCLPRVCLG